jgi:hypothetical protein
MGAAHLPLLPSAFIRVHLRLRLLRRCAPRNDIGSWVGHILNWELPKVSAGHCTHRWRNEARACPRAEPALAKAGAGNDLVTQGRDALATATGPHFLRLCFVTCGGTMV